MTRAIYSNVRMYLATYEEVKNSANRERERGFYLTFPTIHSISSVQFRQARFRLIPESIIHTYLPTLTFFFPLHLDLAAPYHETSTYIAASASGGGKSDRR